MTKHYKKRYKFVVQILQCIRVRSFLIEKAERQDFMHMIARPLINKKHKKKSEKQCEVRSMWLMAEGLFNSVLAMVDLVELGMAE